MRGKFKYFSKCPPNLFLVKFTPHYERPLRGFLRAHQGPNRPCARITQMDSPFDLAESASSIASLYKDCCDQTKEYHQISVMFRNNNHVQSLRSTAIGSSLQFRKVPRGSAKFREVPRGSVKLCDDRVNIIVVLENCTPANNKYDQEE